MWRNGSTLCPCFDGGIKCVNCVILLSPELCISSCLGQENIMGSLINHQPILQNYYLRFIWKDTRSKILQHTKHRVVRYRQHIKGLYKGCSINNILKNLEFNRYSLPPPTPPPLYKSYGLVNKTIYQFHTTATDTLLFVQNPSEVSMQKVINDIQAEK